jgi:hypothetical protein
MRFHVQFAAFGMLSYLLSVRTISIIVHISGKRHFKIYHPALATNVWTQEYEDSRTSNPKRNDNI